MRIMFTAAAPWVNSGYGKPMRSLVPMLTEAGHEVAIAAFYGFQGTVAEMEIGGVQVRVYPIMKASYFNDAIEHHARDFNADVVITLQDVWILQKWGTRGFTWCPWMPVDTHPVTDMILDSLTSCHTALCYTHWAQRELDAHGYENNRYMPLGTDTNIYKPMDKREMRAQFGFPEDTFIAGMVGANSSYPSRKSIPEVIIAWKQWVDDGRDGLLYIHTSLSPKGKFEYGVDFERLLKIIDIPWSTIDDPDKERQARARVILPSQYKYWTGTYDDDELAQLINTFDVLMEPSMAEGFGLPIIEAQACGVPVVTLNNTSMPELTFAGKCLEPVQKCWDLAGAFRHIAPVQGIYDSLVWASELSAKEHAELALVGRQAAMQFDWQEIVDVYMLPFLDELENEL